MQQCGLCSALSGLIRRAMCVGSRRGSSESYYREIGDQDTLRIDDRSSDVSDYESEVIIQDSPEPVAQTTFINDNDSPTKRTTGRFHTMHKRPRRRLVTRSLCYERALLDDLQLGQVQCILEQSDSWKFNAFTLETASGGRCLPVLSLHLFHVYGLIPHFKLDVAKVWKLFSLIEEGYHGSNPYHNSVHAADVTQAMHCFLQQKQIREHLEPAEIMASLLAAIAHDMDHPGVNQPFLIATSNHLATLYGNTSVLENHHWRSAISCLIESRLLDKVDARREIEKQISSLIMATDITRQQEFLTQFKMRLDNNTLDLKSKDHRLLVLQIALKCADISNPCRMWYISKKWSLKVCEEFFRQGDYERKLNLPITALCDRYNNSIPKIQTGFLGYVVTPLVMEWHRLLQNELSIQMLQNLKYNQGKWEELAAQELAEETKTEISEADVVEEDLDSCSGTNISDSSELLLPLRRSSLNPTKPNILKEQLRRFSVPLNVFQDSRSRQREKSRDSIAAVARSKEPTTSAASSEYSVHSELVVYAHVHGVDKDISTEKLLPDTSIASLTTPMQATRLSTVLKDGGSWKLIRQQTFPPLETTARSLGTVDRSHYTSEDNAIYPQRCTTEYDTRLDSGKIVGGKFDNLFKKNYIEKTENDDTMKLDVSECSCNLGMEMLSPPAMGVSGRREAGMAGSQLRDNLTSIQLDTLSSGNLLLRRRQSMPIDALTQTPMEKKMREMTSAIPEFLRRTLSGKEPGARRRGSAPLVEAPSELRGLAALGALRHSVNGGRKKTTPATCQQWLAKSSSDMGALLTPRRSSLPVEVITGISSR